LKICPYIEGDDKKTKGEIRHAV
ncbi:MAG: hypothetical protein RLZ59_943, partial [Pseudomonadota bacterium]